MPNLILLSLLAAFPPLSTDMYLPAIPTLQQVWDIPLAQVNLSLVVYFVAFSCFLLVHGPLSDRVGRRPVLIGGIIVFILGSVLCAASSSIVFLVIARIIQASGAAAASALALALSKDLYEGEERQKILAYMGVIMAFCPMIAPSIGGLILEFASWRWVFILQGSLALVALYGTLRLQEPLTEFTSGGVFSVAGRYLQVFKNGRFTALALAFAVMVLPHFAFIGGSPAIYITGFSMSEQMFGVYFGANALGLMLGSFACTRLATGLKPMHGLIASLCGMLAAGVLMLALGGTSALMVAFPMFFISFTVGFSRPISNNLILEQVDSDVGAASSVMTFEMFMVGGIAMEVISLAWPSKVMVLGSLALIGALVPLAALGLMRFASQRVK